MEWIEEVEDGLEEKDTFTADTISKLVEKGLLLPPSPQIENYLAKLREIMSQVERWEERASGALQEHMTLEDAEKLIEEIDDVPALMPTVSNFKDSVKKAKEWIVKVEALEKSEQPPFLETVEQIVSRGKPIPIQLPNLLELETNIAKAQDWLDTASRTFLKKTTGTSFLEV